MRLMSFARQDLKLIPIEVEVSLVPGLPIIRFIGQPDSAIKESAGKIKSALFHQGFRFPKARQVLVNLRPSHIKKTSQGLDLAIASAILWQTQQVPPPFTATDLYVYGELSLTGGVLA
jgi:magnesium chelatase family protein